jgi:hypothetical protein
MIDDFEDGFRNDWRIWIRIRLDRIIRDDISLNNIMIILCIKYDYNWIDN